MSNSPSQKVVIVTGCSAGGIGFALCEAFHSSSCRVFACSRNVGKMGGLSAGIEKVCLDVNDEESVRRGVEQILGKVGRIDILVNNAGQGCVAPIIEVGMSRVRDTFNVNVFGLISMVQAVSNIMISQRSGTIINIASIVAYVPTPWASIYCASKAAVLSLSDCMRMELAGFGINVMCVCPGAIKSGIGAANDSATFLKPDSHYTNIEQEIRSRGSWSQTPHSTTSEELAAMIVKQALAPAGPPRNLAAGYRSLSAVLSFYLPSALKDWFWATQFGVARVGK